MEILLECSAVGTMGQTNILASTAGINLKGMGREADSVSEEICRIVGCPGLTGFVRADVELPLSA